MAKSGSTPMSPKSNAADAEGSSLFAAAAAPDSQVVPGAEPVAEVPAGVAKAAVVPRANEISNGKPDPLNTAQRAAVMHEGCPLIVLAGPGTGKTRVIVQRVAHLIGGRGVEPEQILVSTFTNKAARELRERLAGLIGAAKAERVRACTLHSLGYQLVRRFADAIDLPPLGTGEGRGGGGAGGRGLDAAGRVRRCELIDSAQARRLLRDLILKHDLFGPERAGGVDAIAERAQRYFEYFENHALGPEDVAGLAGRWRTSCEREEDLSGNPLSRVELEAEEARRARFDGMATLYAEYVRERRSRGLLTHGDMLMLPIELLRRRGDVAAIVRDDFRHVIVDEFQDVNQANIAMLALLAPPSHCRGEQRPDGQELVVVGDDDQAIYGFRGADDRAFWRFESIWSECRRVALTENYRSRPGIIALCNGVITKAAERFAPEKKTEFPLNGKIDPPGRLECVNLEDDKADGEAIAALLLRDRAERGDAGPDPWRRYAVVVRNHGDAERIHEALWMEGIPSVKDRSHSAADNDGVQYVLAWARLIAQPRDMWNASRVLRDPPLGLPIERISAWGKEYRAALSRWRRSDTGGLPGSFEDPGDFANWLLNRDGGDPMVARFANWHAQFVEAAARLGGAAVLLRIVRETGVIHADLPDSEKRAERVAAVVALLRFAHERQERLPAPGGLREFLDYYDDLNDAEKRLDRGDHGDQTSPELAGESAPDPDADHPNAVLLITAHGAKGLEFDTVFVPRVHPTGGYGRAREDDSLEIPDQLMQRVGSALTPIERARAEERRVFYVACTRAMNRLVVLAKRNKKPSAGTNFFEEIVLDPPLMKSANVQERWQADILRDAAAAGGSSSATRRVDPGLRELKDVEQRREAFAQARAAARQSAAAALSRMDSPSATPAEYEQAVREMSLAAQRLAAIAAAETALHPPKFVDTGDPVVRQIEKLAAPPKKLDKRAAERVVFTPPVAPLHLSYTCIEDYRSCPRCWYVKHIMQMEGPPARQMQHGGALHRALERFYRAVQAAEAGGGAPPTLPTLEAMARREFAALGGEPSASEAADLDKLLSQVRVVYAKLHDASAQILEVERTIRFKYKLGPSTHDFEAKIDRLDLITMPDGSAGYRIIDYKSGRAAKRFTEPEADDLQLVIYAMALRAEFGADVDGIAEYWVAATGERGELPFDRMNFDKAREQIEEVVKGILGGDFHREKKCGGVCGVLGPDGIGGGR